MSPRHKRLRKIITPPVIKGYKPYGPDISTTSKDSVVMLLEEYEALKLCDYDMLNHELASQAMQVSRPTFTRVYSAARQKIAKAFVEGRPIAIEGGKVYFDSNWYHCKSCDCFFNNPEMDKKITACPLCGSDRFSNYDLKEQTPPTKACNEGIEQKSCGKGYRKRKGKQQD